MKTRMSISSFVRQLIANLICGIAALLFAKDSHAAFGDILAQYSFSASSLVMSPTQPHIYATIQSQNAVAIINTNTLVVESTIFVGSGPTNLAFSPDGLKAYIAASTSSFVVVFDTQTRMVTNSFVLPEHPQDVVFANQNRLFVLGQNNIFQIDATTGAPTGPSISIFIYSGSLEISPDRNTLYYGDYGLSPSTMYKYDISGVTPVLLMQTPFGTVGSNGQALTLSHDGSFICYAVGSGNNNYDIAKFRTSDFAELGSFNTGPYPRQIGFSSDDLVAYAVHTDGEINVFNANTFLSIGTISASGQASGALTVDSTGRYLFAAYDTFGNFNGTRVFDTGRVFAVGAVSRKAHGAAGNFDIALPLTGTAGIECRTDGATNDYTMVVTFSAGVAVTGSPQAQVTSGSATIGSGGVSNGGVVDISGPAVTIPLTNVANVQTISVRLNGVNSISGIGSVPVNVDVRMSLLQGDVNGNGAVNAADVSVCKSHIGEAVNSTNFAADVNANGLINATDAAIVKAHIGTGLP